MLFISDVHGKFDQYKKILKTCENSIQLGDLGIGFSKFIGGERKFSENPPYDDMVKGNHRFIRGNHDNPDTCSRHSQWIKDGTTETTSKGNKMMFLGGAWSIDRQWRTEGQDWWSGEELSIFELEKMIDIYQTFKPDIMITHDFPMNIGYQLFLQGTHKPVLPSRTGQALDCMFDIHKPRVWIGAHWHVFRDQIIDSCRFLCMEELGTFESDF